MTALYNEIDPYAAQWMRNLIAAGHIAPGVVDERSITELDPDELKQYTQCHFFAGIGVWSHALRSAGWPDDRPVWTGSCPCQPFSVAGKGEGFDDERHLWPAWFRLIRERKPVAIFGEQVASKDALAWLDHVSTDLEAAGYTVGAVDSCAAGYGAPHIRQRLYFVGHASSKRLTERGVQLRKSQHEGEAVHDQLTASGRGESGELADSERGAAERHRHEVGGAAGGMQGEARQQRIRDDVGDGINAGELADSELSGPSRLDKLGWTTATTEGRIRNAAPGHSGPCNGFWSNAEWIPCRDGKARPTKPGIFPLAHGAAQRVGRLRAYGNAICAPQAAEFVAAAMEAL